MLLLFFGHMVLWQTRTNDELKSYMVVLTFITYVIPDDIFELIEASEVVWKP